MIDEIQEAILSGLKGAFIHSDPLTIIKGLTPDSARKKPAGSFNHSCWDILYHTVIWNDIFLGNIKGNVENWNPENNWPSEKELQHDINFYTLMKRFEANIQEVRELLPCTESEFSNKKKLSTTNTYELSSIKLFITILQHISYHVGQIACVRKMINDWPKT